MSFFVPGSWNSALPGSVSQPSIVGAGISALGTAMASRFSRYKSLRGGKRRRLNPIRRGRRTKARNRAITSGRGLTFQHDRQFIYRRKRMPRGKRRRWTRFKSKVNAVSDKSLGSRTILFNKSHAYSNATSQNQGLVNLCLYGWDSSAANSTWHNDLRYISKLENTNTTNDLSMQQEVPFMFQSAILDITMRNVSFVTGQSDLDPAATLEVDLYEWTMKREAEINGVNYQTGHALFTQTALDPTPIFDNNVSANSTPVLLSQRGSTPWECTTVLSGFGVKILKKTKFFIGSGQTATYQMRDPKRHVITKKKLQTDTSGTSGFNYPRLTRNVMIVFKAVPGISIGGGGTTEMLNVGVTRKYMYKVRGINARGSAYING